jgi:hypothetical protein
MATHVFVTLLHLPSCVTTSRDLGEFGAFWATTNNWNDGPLVGSDPSCSIVLNTPEVPAKAARLAHPSNHIYVTAIEPVRVKLDGPPAALAPGQSCRIDHVGALLVGNWLVQFSERRVP